MVGFGFVVGFGFGLEFVVAFGFVGVGVVAFMVAFGFGFEFVVAFGFVDVMPRFATWGLFVLFVLFVLWPSLPIIASASDAQWWIAGIMLGCVVAFGNVDD